ncbi:MarR family transcriptional regulator [Paenibacillus sp. JX-17]|uniref:MarR family transcriptional regulator n=1 Tax=Paenibacillus lacisoli TaxID=3064525 RepID=A0ABT9CE16_9BACL|nr:MarR family transcriptional regulator [Paenibacillus sp. JX-17]MDO7906879.1 MarR family transcriptional regulator [Paenibacillus sp. JX-17]
MSNSGPFLSLDDHLCFSLYASSRAILRLYRPFLDEIGLTYPQYLVLLVLWEQGQTTVKVLGQRLELDSGTLTPMLKRMEAAGLVERSRTTEDERFVMVKITDKGAELRDKAMCIPRSLFEASGMTVEETQALNSAIRKLSHQVNDK